jgi:geranylgeranylglycerol-phosphate geranylgeranyltransferase
MIRRCSIVVMLVLVGGWGGVSALLQSSSLSSSGLLLAPTGRSTWGARGRSGRGRDRGVIARPAAAAATKLPQQQELAVSPYLTLLRPQNIVPSIALVAAGALTGGGPMALVSRKVVLTQVAAVMVACGSCVLNDVFDMSVDAVNKPDRPLVSGAVPPIHAILMSLTCLSIALVTGAMVSPAALQAVIVGCVGLVVAYTPFLKPIPLVKNIVAAGVIATAISAGGMAAGALPSASLSPALITFCGTLFREIMMDIGDVDGDRRAGVNTLPVLFGQGTGLAVALAVLSTGVSVVSGQLLRARGLVASIAIVVASLPLYASAGRVMTRNFDETSVKQAVEGAFVPLFLSLAVLAVCR